MKPWKEVMIPRGEPLDDYLPLAKSDDEMAAMMMQRDQPPCPVIHRFGPGIYIREATYPANTLIIGQNHIHPHTNVLLKGSILIVDGEGKTAKLTAPFVFVAPHGSKKGYTLEETVWQNIYATNETNVELLEKMLFVQPQVLLEHTKERLIEQAVQKNIDRDDFNSMLVESGWSSEEVSKISAYRDDCIPFPWGSYSIAQGDSPIHGKGMFATADILKDQMIAPMRLSGMRTPAGYLINHAFDPNCKAVLSDNGDIYLVAIKNISGMRGGDLGEELTLDYRQIMQINGLWRAELCQQQQQQPL